MQATLAAETTKVIGTVNVAAAQTIAATQSGTWNVTNVSGTVSLPTGASTAANQSTEIGHLATLAGAVAGTEVQVDVLTMPTVAVTGTFWQATQPVSGTVTANAGTNLNTSALALEAGGNLAAAATSLATLDNCISGSEAQVDIVTIAAGQGVVAQQSSSVVYDGTTACTVKRFNVVTSTSGTAVIPAPTGTKKIRVLSLSAICLSATSYTWYLETGTTGTDTFGTAAGQIKFDMDGTDGPSGLVLPWNPGGWFETADADESLDVILSAAQLILLCGNYIEVA